nr:DNA/RNA non-specific endonuclease [Gordonia araii]
MPEGHPRPEFTNEVDVTGKDVPGKRTPFAARTDLEPNTLYHVEGRGDFYTDHTGRVVFVEATYGVKGNLNADLNRPQPDTTYVVHPDVTNPIPGVSHAHVFETDHLGRVVFAHTDALVLGDASRSESIQQRIGDQGGDGYDGGHTFANFAGGGPESINLFAMLESVNRGSGDSFYNLEGKWRGALGVEPPPIIPVTVKPIYNDGGSVPTKFIVQYTIGGGRPEERTFKNELE